MRQSKTLPQTTIVKLENIPGFTHFWIGNTASSNKRFPGSTLSNCVTKTAVAITALLVLSSLVILPTGIAGKFPLPAFKWTVVALSGALFAGWLLMGGIKDRKLHTGIALALCSTLVALAVLQHISILSYKQAAIGMLTTFVGGCALVMLAESAIKRAFKEKEHGN